MSQTTSENLRYLLWKQGIPIRKWSVQLADWAKCELGRARALLLGAEPLADEQTDIANRLNMEEEDLQFRRLVEVEDILEKNLTYLFGSLEHGDQKQLARRVEADVNTVSRWVTGKQRPRRSYYAGLCHYFGLGSNTDLTTDPVFLSLDPIGVRGRRDWLRERIDHMDPAELQDLFPALRLIFRD